MHCGRLASPGPGAVCCGHDMELGSAVVGCRRWALRSRTGQWAEGGSTAPTVLALATRPGAPRCRQHAQIGPCAVCGAMIKAGSAVRGGRWVRGGSGVGCHTRPQPTAAPGSQHARPRGWGGASTCAAQVCGRDAWLVMSHARPVALARLWHPQPAEQAQAAAASLASSMVAAAASVGVTKFSRSYVTGQLAPCACFKISREDNGRA